MSKKKSNKNAADMLDDNLVSKVEPKTTPIATGAEVSLKEYSKSAPYAFNNKNYKLLLIGLAINVFGFILMIGGGAEDPNEFHAETLFSTVRITISPMFIVLGYAVIMYAIMKKPKPADK
jgi:hypothetical protein